MPPDGRPPGYADALARVVRTALEEDLGTPPRSEADATGAATVPAGARLSARIVARQVGVVAGLAAVAATYDELGGAVTTVLLAADGDAVAPGRAVAQIDGPARAVLAGERTALNLLGHLSGVATTTARYVAAVAGTRCAVRDTRKTLPGLRALEKAAVVAGGGVNHRMSLTAGILLKDNHVAAAGGIGPAVRGALAAGGGLPVQVEVDDLAQLDDALAEGATSVLCDNFALEDLRAAVARCRVAGRDVVVEASGGVTLATAGAIAATGVDAVSVGALTHSAPALDLGLDAVLDVRSVRDDRDAAAG